MNKTVTAYIPLCNALVTLLKPLVEVVIHDLQTNTICYIEGTLSKRKVGDPSLLNKQDLEEDLDKIVYPKLGFDGRLIKSISIPVEKRWLICINCDVSIFNQMQTISQAFLTVSQRSGPKSLFKNDWQEKVHQSIHLFMTRHNWSFEHLTGSQKKEVVHHLFVQGAFEEKNAASYIAKILSMGRATIFNYLNEWKQA